MAEVREVHHVSEPASGNGMGFMLGVILLIAFLFILFYFGLPMFNQANQGPQINVPNQFDVNVKQQPGQ